MPNEFTALGSVHAPDSYAAGYRRGDEVSAQVVENWGLVVGEDVVEGDLTEDNDPAVVRLHTRPNEGATRADWEAWAVYNGMDADDAATATMEDLQDAGTKNDPQRPADSAKKAEWVAWVIDQGADDGWARADSTTKADLQAWEPEAVAADEPESGDPVAESATEANQA